jgi:flagellar biosynthesis protein FlhF
MKKEKKDFTKQEQVQIAKSVLLDEFSDLPFGGISFQKKYINVLGPTGVGKTTTIAKVAARALLEEKKKIGFITTDTYRIAAIEQLRTYANLLQAPVEIAYNRSDFEEAISKMKDRDLIFIDTAGRNYKEMKFVDDVKSLIDFSMDMESFLVLSVTSKEEDMKTIIERFTSFPIEKFIFTKVDETESFGPMFNLMKKYGIGTAYYTDGQEVPEDIVEADLDKMLSLLLAGAEHA